MTSRTWTSAPDRGDSFAAQPERARVPKHPGPLPASPPPRSLGIRAAKASLSTVLDEVAAGSHVLLCRRAKPVAVLIPPQDLERFRELVRRDEELAAVLRARGHHVDQWTTAALIEVIVSYLEAPRKPSNARRRSRAARALGDRSERQPAWS